MHVFSIKSGQTSHSIGHMALCMCDMHACNAGKKKGVKTKGKSKKSRRADEVERAFHEAEATADRAAARTTQSQMLLALFEVFFRVLKQCTQSGIQAQQAQGRLL